MLRRWKWLLVVPVLLVLAVALLDVFVDKPLRRYIERTMNQQLRGYTVSVRSVDFNPWNFSLSVENSLVRQNAHPDPPVALFPRLNFNVQWRSIVFGRVVADFRVEHPRLHVNLEQIRQEWEDDVDMEDRGWQDAIEAIYPLKINSLELVDGSLTYIDENPDKPLEIHRAVLFAQDIRNVRSKPGTYPSPLEFRCNLFDRGRALFEGHADFLAEPHVGVKALGRIDRVPLDRLAPIIEDYHVKVSQGELSARGLVEYAPGIYVAHMEEVLIAGVHVDYLSEPGAEAEQAAMVDAAVDAAQEASNDPEMLLKIDLLRVLDSVFGYVNNTTKPPYRVFLADADLRMENVSNQAAEGTAAIEAKGLFMGSGGSTLKGTFRPDHNGADFDLDIKIHDTKMRSMNDLLRAYANLDVTEGFFSFFSELKIQNGRIEGYIKPLFRDLNIYDKEQDRKKNIFRKIYEGVAEGLAGLLENNPRDEVATVTKISGPVEDPKTRNWQVVVNLVRNAFFQAILPGFEEEIGKLGKRRKDKKKDQDKNEKR